MTKVDLKLVMGEVPLPDGSRIVVLDRMAAPSSVADDEVDHNVYRIGQTGAVQWQIAAESGIDERSPFTGILLAPNGALMAYRWDGVEYIIDINTGKAVASRFVK